MHRTSILFRYKDNTTVLALSDTSADECGQLVNISVVFRNDSCFRSCCNSTILRQETCVPAHHLHEEDAIMACSCVPDFIYALNDGIERSVVSNGGVGAV